MRTIALETASWVALRNCSQEVGGRAVFYTVLVKGVGVVKHTFRQRLAASREKQTSPLMTSVLF